MARSVACSRPASPRRVFSASSRMWGLVGSSSIASQMTPACSGETSPSRNASRVSDRSPTRSLAWRTAAWPVRRWVPARWVNQSPVEDHDSCCRAILRSSTSTRAAASMAARWARSVSHAVTVSTTSSGALAAQRTSSREPSTAFAAAATSAGLFGGNVVLSMRPWKHRPPTAGGRWAARIPASEILSKKSSSCHDALGCGVSRLGRCAPSHLDQRGDAFAPHILDLAVPVGVATVRTRWTTMAASSSRQTVKASHSSARPTSSTTGRSSARPR